MKPSKRARQNGLYNNDYFLQRSIGGEFCLGHFLTSTFHGSTFYLVLLFHYLGFFNDVYLRNFNYFFGIRDIYLKKKFNSIQFNKNKYNFFLIEKLLQINSLRYRYSSFHFILRCKKILKGDFIHHN